MECGRAVVVCGGRGSRLGPLGTVVHKALLPVAGRPIISHLMDGLASAGVRTVTVVVDHCAEQLSSYLRATVGDGLRLTFHREVGGGTLNSVAAVEDLTEERFLYCHGNILLPPGLFHQLLSKHAEAGTAIASVALSSQDRAPTHPHAHIVDEKVMRFADDGSGLCSVGLSVIEQSALLPLRTEATRGPLPLELGLNSAIADGAAVQGYVFEGDWFHLEDLTAFSEIGAAVLGSGNS